VACTAVDGHPVAITGDGDGTVQVWDLATGEWRANLRGDIPSEVLALACGTTAGYPFVIATGKEGIRVSGLTTSTARPPVSTYLRAGDGAADTSWATIRALARSARDWAVSVTAVACTVLDGRPVAITGQGTKVRVWDLTTGQERATFASPTGQVRAIACTVLNGRPAAVVGVGTAVKVWDLTTGHECAVLKDRRRVLLPSHWVRAVACTVLDGRPAAIVGQGPEVRVWDLTTGQERATLAGHADTVKAVACCTLDDRPVAVTGGDDRVVRVWDLTAEKAIATLCMPYRVAAVGVGTDQSLVVGSWQEVIVLERNPDYSGSSATLTTALIGRDSLSARWGNRSPRP
jgi:WD40 repeat protein